MPVSFSISFFLAISRGCDPPHPLRRALALRLHITAPFSIVNSNPARLYRVLKELLDVHKLFQDFLLTFPSQ